MEVGNTVTVRPRQAGGAAAAIALAEPDILLGGAKLIAASRPIIQMEITISDLPLKLENYTGFQCPGGVNKLWIPNESPKIGIPKDLGWQKLS